ncbi:type 2 isopentenyl-diphosphate Delta-isomerase [Aureimonas sp. ME7]|uniref:type 2 isopentenyl-diphosphate Delta-isomerase n=1 Tax=Aureimonas sp. ME7 TaxID=2744252 RepID=UPI001FCEBD39|nr:type 2 isopentenyl-diphosphate Delta-isomerase [Aureimonas sp. ME7]
MNATNRHSAPAPHPVARTATGMGKGGAVLDGSGRESEGEGEIGARKSDHLDIALQPSLPGSRADTGFDRVRFEHVALPELDLDAIDLSTRFLGRAMRAPILISSMTGGPERAGAINARLAEATEHLGLALAVGSQRIALEGRGSGGLGADLRRRAPHVPLLANIGGAQLAAGWGVREARRAVEMIEADALIVHLNPLQEAVQTGGDRNWAGVLGAIEALAREAGFPIVVKEVGAGLSATVARRLVEAGVHAIDVAGAGGTSWAAIEAERSADPRVRGSALLFSDWGIPTADAIAEVRAACPQAFVIGSGGVRHGLDAARAIRLGADLVGQAGASLAAADVSTERVVAHFAGVVEELRIACFCTGSADLEALRTARLRPAEAPARS